MKLLRMAKGIKQLCANQNRDADVLQSGNDYGKSLQEIRMTYVLH